MTPADQARELAAWINAQGCRFEAVATFDGPEAFVFVLTHLLGRSLPEASSLSFRFGLDAQVGTGVVSVDPVSGNTMADARAAFRAVHLNGRAVTIRRAIAWTSPTRLCDVRIASETSAVNIRSMRAGEAVQPKRRPKAMDLAQLELF